LLARLLETEGVAETFLKLEDDESSLISRVIAYLFADLALLLLGRD